MGAAVACVLLAAGLGGARADELADKIALCVTCHGQSGLPSQPDVPIIAGQEYYYLYVQLKDYKAGRRANPVMSGIVASLSKEDMQVLADHFSKQTWPSIGFTATEADISSAQMEVAAGMCTQCHLGKFVGNSRIPRLAGQQPAYLERTMLEFKNKIRLNAPAIGSLFTSYEDDQIRAMAHYLGGY